MNRYQNDLRPYKRNFLLATALFLIVSTAFSLQERERKILGIREKELLRAKEGSFRVRSAIQERRDSLATLKSQFSSDTAKTSPARLIYSRVDEIKARYKPDDMVITAIEKKDAEVSLKYTLSFSNTDYSALLNTLGELQHNVFPFTPVESVAISQGDNKGKGGLLKVINGSVISFEGNKP